MTRSTRIQNLVTAALIIGGCGGFIAGYVVKMLEYVR